MEKGLLLSAFRVLVLASCFLQYSGSMSITLLMTASIGIDL